MAAAGRIHPHQNLQRACLAHFLAGAQRRGLGPDASRVAAALWPDDQVSPLVAKAATAGATTTGTGWAAELATQAVSAFFASLAPASAASRLLLAGTPVALAPFSTISIPSRAGDPTAPTWVGEGDPVPVRSYALGSALLGPVKKMATIVVASRELAEHSAGEEVLTQLLREDAALGLDAAVFSINAATDDSAAGLLAGVTPLAASAATDPLPAMRADLAALAGAVTGAGGGAVAYVANPKQAAAVALYLPELRLPVWPSRAVPDGRVIALDPTVFLGAFDPVPDISTGKQAVLHMSDAPAHIGAAGSPNVVAAPARSLFQTDCLAVRLIVQTAFAMGRPGLVAYIANVAW